jgi:hypothetical protein
MAKNNIPAADDVQPPATSRPRERTWDLLEPGPGTPWEDRGAVGPVAALFKTIGQSMVAPARLLDSIRRPETPGDARAFAIVCGAFFGLAWVMNDAIALARSGDQFDVVEHGYTMATHFALGAGGTWVMLLLITRLFYKLVSAAEMKHKFPPVLAFNVYAYCLGPAVLAFIPFYVGFAVALAWIFCLFVYAAKTRLAIATSGAIICNVIAAGGLFGLAIAAYFALRYLINWLYF